MSPDEYPVQVTRTEVHSVSEHDLQRERLFRAGQVDRRAGIGASSVNGAYLNGWYNPDRECWYVERAAMHLVG